MNTHPHLKLDQTPTGPDACTLAIEGELDIGTAPEFRTTIGTLLGAGCRHLVLDLSRTSFMDSSGLGALLWAANRLRGAGGELVAERPSAAVARTLRITGVDRLLMQPRAAS